MRILILAQYFPPETAATGRRAQELAASLAIRGHEVMVLTGRPNHPALGHRYFCRGAATCEQAPEGYRIRRLAVFRSPDARAWKRWLNYLTFVALAIARGLVAGRPDSIAAISPLPAGLAALVLGAWHGSPFVYDLQDIWPDSARAVGVMRRGIALRILGCCERLLYRRAARMAVISQGFHDYLAGLGVPRQRLRLIPNGVDADFFRCARFDTRLRRAHPLRGRLLVGYIGNLGLAQGLDTLLDAAERLREDPVAFVLIGEGVEKARLEARARAAGLDNVRFLRGVPRRRVPALLAACDALLVILRDDPLFRITIPSKLYEYMAAGKAILCSAGGEAASIVESAKCGLSTPPSDGAALAEAVRSLAKDPGARAKMGEAGAACAMERFSLSSLMASYVEFVETSAAGEADPQSTAEPIGARAPSRL